MKDNTIERNKKSGVFVQDKGTVVFQNPHECSVEVAPGGRRVDQADEQSARESETPVDETC
jgi:hypothetical protein